MAGYDLESLRNAMIFAFYGWVNTPSDITKARETAWNQYCEARELFLQADCFRIGIKYERLKEQIIRE